MQALTAGPRAHLPAAEVVETLALEHVPRVRHGVDVLDAQDRPTGEPALVDWRAGGEVRWAYRAPEQDTAPERDAAAVRRVGRLTLVGTPTFNVVARRLRVWTELLSPRGDWVRFYLGVMVATNPGGASDDGTLVSRALELADKTYSYGQVPLREPLTVSAGTPGTAWVQDRLQSVFGETRFAIPESQAALVDDKVFPQGMSELAAINAVLEGVAFDQLTVDEEGRPASQPLADLAVRGPEHTYEPGTTILTAGQVQPLLPTLPNVLWFVARKGPSLPEIGNGIAERRNESTGPGSVSARGGREVFERVDVEAETQEALEAVADVQAQRYFAGGGERFTGSVGLNPRHSDSDVIGLVKPRLGLIGGAWLVTEWVYPLGDFTSDEHALMRITAERRVAL